MQLGYLRRGLGCRWVAVPTGVLQLRVPFPKHNPHGLRSAVQPQQRRRVAAGHQSPPPPPGVRHPAGRHAALLRGDHPAAPPRPRRLPAAARHEGHHMRGGRLPALLDAVPPGGDGRHLLPAEDRGVRVPGEDGGGPGHVCHAEPGAAAQLRQPGAVRVCWGEVQEEAAAENEEDGTVGAGVDLQGQQVLHIIGNHINSHVKMLLRAAG